MADERRAVRLVAIGDLHCPRTPPPELRATLEQAAREADVLLLCGDLTDHGLEEEARLLAKELTAVVKVPVVAVLGNHDWESGNAAEVTKILADAGVTILDGEACEIQGVGFAGVKGFGGGFGERALQPWGEETIKRFVHEAVEEALKLESALAKLRTTHRVAVLHYSPIAGTVEGESPEIYPFLGSSRLEEPLIRYPVAAVFHGHAHSGRLEGRTRSDVPVYNVSLPLLNRALGGRPAAHTIEIAAKVADAA